MIGRHYKRALAVSTVLLFYTNLSLYLHSSELVSVPSFYYVIGLAVAALPCLFSHQSLAMFRYSSIVRWCCGFIGISALWIVFQPAASEATWSELSLRAASMMFILILLGVFSDPDAQRSARWAVLLAVLMGVGINVYEVFNPLSFSMILGRSAGFYINPNQCGAALVLGMTLSISLLPQRYRLLFALIVGFAVFLTFSRAALIGWFIVIFIIIRFGEINLKRSLLIGSTIVILAAVIVLWQWNSLQYRLEGLGVLNTNVLARVAWLNNFASDDYSSIERKQVAELAWDMFADRPIFGNGVAASLNWSFEKSSHNQYLNMMVDHGILGMFFLPLLVLAICWRAPVDVKPIAIALGAFISWWGFFSHNIFSERYILLSFSLLSAMVLTSRINQRVLVKAPALNMASATISTSSRSADRAIVAGYHKPHGWESVR